MGVLVLRDAAAGRGLQIRLIEKPVDMRLLTRKGKRSAWLKTTTVIGMSQSPRAIEFAERTPEPLCRPAPKQLLRPGLMRSRPIVATAITRPFRR